MADEPSSLRDGVSSARNKFGSQSDIRADCLVFTPRGSFMRYSQTRLIRTLLICHFGLIHCENLKTLKAISLTPMLNYPLNSSPRLVHRKISAYFSDELSGSNSIAYCSPLDLGRNPIELESLVMLVVLTW